MGTMIVVVAVVSGALVAGAAWGVYGRLPSFVEGFLVALAGGALILSVVSELIEPSIDAAGSALEVLVFVSLGAVVFTGLDHVVDEVWGGQSGGGLLVAITLDGIPENLALGRGPDRCRPVGGGRAGRVDPVVQPARGGGRREADGR